MARRHVNPDDLIDAERIGYSHAVVADGTLYTSGQVGWDAEFDLAGTDVESQTRQAFENLEILLEAVDADIGDVTKVTAHVVDLHANREGFFEVWREVFEAAPNPCLTLLGPHQLAQEGLLVELEAEAPLEE